MQNINEVISSVISEIKKPGFLEVKEGESNLCWDCSKPLNPGDFYKVLKSYGSKVTCSDCCEAELLKNFLKEIPQRYHPADLKDFPTITINASKNYFIHGDVGTGKTHLAVAIARKIITAYGKKPILVKQFELFTRLRQSFNNSSSKETEESIIKPYRSEQNVLIIDDLGGIRASETDYTVETLENIIDSRYMNMSQIIVTSNYTLAEIAGSFHPRIASRLSQMCKGTEGEIINFTGKDRRLTNGK